MRSRSSKTAVGVNREAVSQEMSRRFDAHTCQMDVKKEQPGTGPQEPRMGPMKEKSMANCRQVGKFCVPISSGSVVRVMERGGEARVECLCW